MENNFLFTEIENNQQEQIYNNIKAFNNERNHNSNLILHLNIRSLNANFESLLILIKSLKIEPYIIVCTEVWKLTQYQYYKIKDYNIYYNFGDINQNDGVVVYIREDVTHTTETTTFGKLKIINSCIKLSNKKTLEISSMYRSHDFGCAEFIRNLNEYLEKKRKVTNHLIIGDFNINIKENNIISLTFLNKLYEKGFYPGFTNTTRPTNLTADSGTCIDNIFIKTEFLSTKALTLKAPITDHYPIFLEIKTEKISRNKCEENVTKYNYNSLYNNAMLLDWSKYKKTKNPNEIVNGMIKDIQNCLENSKCTIKNRKSVKKPRKDWITKAIIKSCQTKEILYNKLKRHPENNDLKNQYKNYIKTLDKVIKEAKNNFNKKTIEQNKSDPRKLWTCINEKIGRTRKKDNNTITKIQIDNDTIIDNDTEIANKMNEYYCKLGEKLSNNITVPTHTKLDLPKSNPKTIFIKPTNEKEIINIINQLKLKKGGVDNINAMTLKTLATTISDTLAYVFNLCIELSIWPEALKVAEVVPIYKSGKKNDMGNYRPISLISNIAKIFEKIIHKRVIDFMDESKIISKKQFGFMKNIGTTDALQHICTIIYDKLDKSIPIAVTFLDLAKAFDTVNHEILLDKLYAYGIRGKCYKLLKSYLSTIKQKTIIGKDYSKFNTINTGVPQGTILGPLLFILYVNDLLNNMPENSIMSYADDTAVIATGKTWTEVEDKMNLYLDYVSTWLRLNKLTLNIQKTIFITFGNYCDSVPGTINIKINNQLINRVNEAKYLGIYFDSNMKWNKHIEYLINKTKYLIFIFTKLSKFMDKSTLNMIYYALFNSVISYGITAWGGAYQNNIQLLQSVQTRILKIINKNNFQEIIPLNLQQLFAYDCLRFYYSNLKEQFNNSTRQTRYKSIIPPKHHKTVSNKNSYLRAIFIFNSMPNNLKVLDIEKKSTNKKIKDWIRKNV